VVEVEVGLTNNSQASKKIGTARKDGSPFGDRRPRRIPGMEK